MTKTAWKRFRYWLAWKILPVGKGLIENALADEVPESFPEEYDTVGQVAYLLDVGDDNWFDD